MTTLVFRFTPNFLSRHRHADNTLKHRKALEQVRSAARHALKSAYAALDAAGVEGWLTWGSILGLHREGGFLPRDNDVDIAVPLGSITPAVIAQMESQGLMLFGETKYYGTTYNFKFLYQGVGVDFYAMEDRGGEYWSRSRYGDSCLVYTHPKLPKARRLFEGTQAWVLEPVEDYVRHIYGPGWVKPPVKGWHNSFSLPNLRSIEVTPTRLPQLTGRMLKWKMKAFA